MTTTEFINFWCNRFQEHNRWHRVCKVIARHPAMRITVEFNDGYQVETTWHSIGK